MSQLIYRDRFKPGDVVTWRNEHFATTTNGRPKWGERLTIKEVREVTLAAQEVGYTQHITLVEDTRERVGFGPYEHCYSGAYFRHLTPKKEENIMNVALQLDLTTISKSYPYLSLARQLGISYGDVLILSDLYSPKLTVVSNKIAKPAQDRVNSVNKHLIHHLTCAVETGEIGHGG